MPSAAPPVVLLVLAGLQAACPAYLSAQGLGPARHETIAVAPEEREAALRCDGSPCSEARVEARTHRASGTIYLAGLGIEFVGVAGVGGGAAGRFRTEWIPLVCYFFLRAGVVTAGIPPG